MLDGAARLDETGGQGGRRRPAGDRHDRSRQHVRHARVLQGVPQAGHQADHRHRGLHGPRPPLRAADPARPRRRLGGRHRGRQEALLPPHPAGRERDRLPQPDPALEPGVPRGLLLQAPDRLGAAREVLRGADRHHRLPRRPRAAVAAQRRREGCARQGRAAAGDLRQGQPVRRTAGPRDRRPARHQPEAGRDRQDGSAPRCSPPTTRTTPTARTTRPTMPCCACRPAL